MSKCTALCLGCGFKVPSGNLMTHDNCLICGEENWFIGTPLQVKAKEPVKSYELYSKRLKGLGL